jgi:hypothetical protein
MPSTEIGLSKYENIPFCHAYNTFFCKQSCTISIFRFHSTTKPNEHWFGGAVNIGTAMPFPDDYHLNLYGNNEGNQASPFLLSTTGSLYLE